MLWSSSRESCSRRRSEHTDRNVEFKPTVSFQNNPNSFEIVITWCNIVFPPCKVSNPTNIFKYLTRQFRSGSGYYTPIKNGYPYCIRVKCLKSHSLQRLVLFCRESRYNPFQTIIIHKRRRDIRWKSFDLSLKPLRHILIHLNSCQIWTDMALKKKMGYVHKQSVIRLNENSSLHFKDNNIFSGVWSFRWCGS